LQKGSGLTKYTVYLIKGEDRNGPIEVYRRFNEFYSLREAMKQRWPGCFIPSVPDKDALKKND
jgi:sorting nexin-1/2